MPTVRLVLFVTTIENQSLRCGDKIPTDKIPNEMMVFCPDLFWHFSGSICPDHTNMIGIFSGSSIKHDLVNLSKSSKHFYHYHHHFHPHPHPQSHPHRKEIARTRVAADRGSYLSCDRNWQQWCHDESQASSKLGKVGIWDEDVFVEIYDGIRCKRRTVK